MRRIRRMGTAAMVAAALAASMTIGATRVEAKGKKGDDAQAAICAHLLQVITYEYVNPYIKEVATQLYLGYGCDPALLP